MPGSDCGDEVRRWAIFDTRLHLFRTNRRSPRSSKGDERAQQHAAEASEASGHAISASKGNKILHSPPQRVSRLDDYIDPTPTPLASRWAKSTLEWPAVLSSATSSFRDDDLCELHQILRNLDAERIPVR